MSLPYQPADCQLGKCLAYITLMSKSVKTASGKTKSAPEPEVTVYAPETPRLALLRMAAVGGLLTGIACFLFFLIVAWVGEINPLTPIRYLDAGLVILGCVFTFWYVKNARAFGRFQFWEGLFMGFVLTLVSALITGSLTFGYLQWFAPEVLTEYVSWSVEMAIKMHDQTLEHFSEAGYQDQLRSLRMITASDIFQDILIKKLITSIIIVPILAAMMRRTVLQFRP